MRNRIFGIGCCLCGLVLSGEQIHAQRDAVDKVAVVVGNQIILASEVANQVQLVAFRGDRRPTSQEEIEQLQREVLEEMISDKLFLIEAQKDTSISVRREEVDQALEEQVASVAANFPSEEDFLAGLAQEGLSLRDLKKRYRKEIENQLLKQRYIQKKLYGVSVSRHEVEQFYNQFQDSIPLQPEAIKLAHILIEIAPASEVEDSVLELATRVRKRILDGADFATMSVQYSSLGAGAEGGDLGYVARDDVVPEFARAAFQLQVGDVSGVIRTQFGYHVIKCEGKRDDKLRLRHVLFAVVPSPADSSSAKEVADSLLQEARGGADFAELAKIFSADNDTRASGGELGWFVASMLPPEFTSAVSGWRTPGECRGIVWSRFGLHILKLLDYQPEKKLSLESDFDQIKEMTRQDKTAKMVDNWIDEIKQKTYIDYRIDI